MWDGLPEPLGYPPSWFEVARQDVEVARMVLDPRSWRGSMRARDRRKRAPKHLLAGAPVAAEIVPSLSRSALAFLTEPHLGHPGLTWMLVSSRLGPLAVVQAGRDRALAGALRQAAQDWEVVALSEEEPRSGHAMDKTIEGLVALLRAIPERQRAAWLRTPGGHVGPLWREVVDAGVPAEDLLALWQDTLGGRVRWPVPGDGDHAGDAVGHARALLLPLLLAHVDVAALQDAAVLPARLGDLAADAFTALAATPNTRRWIWSTAEGVGDDEAFWRLLEERTYGHSHFVVLEAHASTGKLAGLLGLVVQGILAGTDTRDEGTREWRKIDVVGIADVLARVSTGTLSVARWGLLVRSALLARVPANLL